ncbi:MAG: divergent PAP2 family protein [Patescibacteria group bacterium]
MDIFVKIIITPFITLFIVQSIKLMTDGIKGNYNIRDMFFTYGGMPSSHTAFVTSLSVMVAYTEGLNSSDFGIAMVLSLIVITDAVILRRYIDGHGRAVKMLVERLPAEEQKKFPHVATRLEHTIPQVLVGAGVGFTIATLIYYIF